MLQVNIIKQSVDRADGRTYISEVMDTETNAVLSRFDEVTKKIDLSCLEGEVGKEILVVHFNADENNVRKFDYNSIRKLTIVGVDENGLQYIQYT